MDSIEELVINASDDNEDRISQSTGFSWPFSNLLNSSNENDNDNDNNSEPPEAKKDSKKRMSLGNSKNKNMKTNTTTNPNIVPLIDDKFSVDRFQHDVEQAKLMRRNMDKRKQLQLQLQQQQKHNTSSTIIINDIKITTESDVRLGLDGLDQAAILLRNGRTREAFKISELSIELLIDYLKSDPQITADIPGMSREVVGVRVQNALTAAEEIKLMLKNNGGNNNKNNNNIPSNDTQQQQPITESPLSRTLNVAIQRVKNVNKNCNNNNNRNAISSHKTRSTAKNINTRRISGTNLPKANTKRNNNESNNIKNTTTTTAIPPINSQDPLVQTIKSELYIDQSQIQPTTWKDIAGLNEAKQTLQEAAILPLMRPDLFSGLRRPRNIILYGPPGTGKTLLVKAVAHESSCVLFVCTASALTSKWHGEGEKLLKTLFQVARAAAPSIIFVDEMDALLSSRKSEGEHEASRRFKTEFMTNLDGIVTNGGGGDGNDKNGKHLLVIAATNCPWDIDSAVLRRFPRRIYIPLPDPTTRKALLKNLLKNAGESDLTKEDIKFIVTRLKGFSGSDIAGIASEASFGPIRSLGGIDAIQTAKSSDIRPIQRQDFDVAINQATKSVTKSLLKQYDEWKEDQAAS